MREWQMVTVAWRSSSRKRDRLADQVAAPDHDGARALQLDAGGVEQAHDAERRARAAGRRARRPGGPGSAGAGRRRPWPDRRASRIAARVDVRRQRELDEDAVGVGARVQRAAPARSSSCVRRGRRQLVRDRRDAALGAGLALVAHVGRRGGVVADQHGRQSGRASEALGEMRPPRPAPRRAPPRPPPCRR